MIKHIPNSITCCNLLSGCISILMLCNGIPELAAIMIFIAAVFDFLDGFAARLLKAYSPLGAQLDSLSDVVSFGVAPSFIMYHFLNKVVSYEMAGINMLAMPAFFLAAFSALRLAKFNIDDRQTTSFIGLPTPAMAIFIASLALTVKGNSLQFMGNLMTNPYFLYAVVLIFSFLMVSEIPFLSLKIKNLKFRENKYIYFIAVFAIVMFAVMQWSSIPFIMLFYVLMSMVKAIAK